MWKALTDLVRSRAKYYRAKAQQIDGRQPFPKGRYAAITAYSTFAAAVLAFVAAGAFWCQLGTMEQANSDSRNAFIQAQKAFVFARRFNVRPVIDDQENVTGWDIEAVLLNSGLTPTVGLISKLNGRADPSEPPTKFRPDNPGDIAEGSMLGPKETEIAQGPIITNEQIKAAAAAGLKLYIWGWIEYNDSFKGTPCHRTQFFNEIQVIGDITKRESPFAFPVAPHNGLNATSDECLHPRPG